MDSEFNSLLNKIAKFFRASLGSRNSLGERARTMNETLEIPINIQPSKERYQIVKAGVQYTVECIGYTNVEDVKEGDYLEVDNIKYLVVGVENEAGQDHHYKLLLVKQ